MSPIKIYNEIDHDRRRFLRNAAVAIAAPQLCGAVGIASETGDEGRMPDLDGAVAGSTPLR